MSTLDIEESMAMTSFGCEAGDDMGAVDLVDDVDGKIGAWVSVLKCEQDPDEVDSIQRRLSGGGQSDVTEDESVGMSSNVRRL